MDVYQVFQVALLRSESHFMWVLFLLRIVKVFYGVCVEHLAAEVSCMDRYCFRTGILNVDFRIGLFIQLRAIFIFRK